MGVGLPCMVIWIVPLLCVVGLVRLWWDVLVQLRPSQPPSCGKCGYNVAALTTMHCPECGGDFRTVGITAPHLDKRMHPAVFTAAWTLLLTLPVWLACLMFVGSWTGASQGSQTGSFYTINSMTVIVGVPIYVVGWMGYVAARRKLAERDARTLNESAATPQA
jgi:hypothetical protein